MAILGGFAFGRASAAEAEATWQLARDHGVNHLDIAPRYADAEEVVGPLLEPVRDQWFVAAKTARSDRDGVRAQLEETLRRLRTDRLDLYQLHGVTDLDELDRRAGAAEALLAARDEGLVSYVGITGHDLGAPAAHREALRRWDFDTVMFPVYPRVWADPVYRADAEALLAECRARDAGAMAIKAVARAPWAGREPTAGTWYEPWTDPGAVARGVRFALSTPGITGFCTPGDRGVLRLALEAAGRFTVMDEAERAGAMADTADLELIFPLADKAVLR